MEFLFSISKIYVPIPKLLGNENTPSVWVILVVVKEGVGTSILLINLIEYEKLVSKLHIEIVRCGIFIPFPPLLPTVSTSLLFKLPKKVNSLLQFIQLNPFDDSSE